MDKFQLRTKCWNIFEKNPHKIKQVCRKIFTEDLNYVPISKFTS